MDRIENQVITKVKDHRLKNKKTITDSTINIYASRIRVLYEEIGGNKRLKTFLNDHISLYDHITKKYTKLSSLKSILWTIQTVSEAFKCTKSAIEKYSTEFKRLQNTNETEQTGDQIEYSEMIQKMEELQSSIKDKEGIALFTTFQYYLIIALYTLIQPLRNNYVDALVFNSIPQTIEENKNYISLQECILTLNKYKTKRVYGTKVITLPDQLITIISQWMELRVKLFPELENTRELLLNTSDRKPLSRRNFSKYLHNIFGKPVSVSMLRKAYITEKYKAAPLGNQMMKDADVMGHSIRTQQTIYRH